MFSFFSFQCQSRGLHQTLETIHAGSNLTLGELKGRRESDCSTDPGSSRSRCSSASSDSSGLETALRAAASTQALIIFDWDDTLLPTTWFRQTRGIGRAAHLYQEHLVKHAKQVEATLRAARQLAPVAIVTLAKPAWLATTARECLPGLNIDALFKELQIQVFFSREEPCPGAWEREDFECLKRASMERCVQQWCAGASRGVGATVLSIGDSVVEHNALQTVLSKGVAGLDEPLCKTLKFVDNPKLPQLTDELRQLTLCLGQFVVSTKAATVTVADSRLLRDGVRAAV